MRKIQHVADSEDITEAKRAGKKVAVLCGKKVYPMTEMDESVPTCTRCHRLEREKWIERLRRAKGLWTWAA